MREAGATAATVMPMTVTEPYGDQSVWSVKLASDHIDVMRLGEKVTTIPAHLRNHGKEIWIGTRANEERTRARVRAIERQRRAMTDPETGYLRAESEDALFVSENSAHESTYRKYLLMDLLDSPQR